MSDRRRTPVRGAMIRHPTEGRPRRASEEHGWSHFEQTVLEKLENLGDALGDVAARVVKLEDHRIATDSADGVRDRIWRWVLGLVAVLLAALLVSQFKLK